MKHWLHTYKSIRTIFPIRIGLFLCIIALFAELSRAQDASHFLKIGDAAMKALDAKTALHAYRDAEQADASNVDALCRLSELFLDFTVMNSTDKLSISYFKPAFDYATRAVKCDRESAPAQACMARCFLLKTQFESGREQRFDLYRKAFGSAEKAVKRDPANPRATLALAECNRRYCSEHWALRTAMKVWLNWYPDASLSKAEALVRGVLSKDSANIRALYELAQILRVSDKSDNSDETLHRIQNATPREPMEVYLKAEAAALLKK